MDFLDFLIITTGWIYFTAWSISFYPQIWVNFKRKSVVGLSFDFLALNFTGFLCYSIYNVCIYFVPNYQQAFIKEHNTTVSVLLNDVGFSIHALVITLVTIIQCFIYERGGQNISLIVVMFLIAVWTAGAILSLLAYIDKLSLVSHANYFSSVKIIITVIKYTPQAWFNYKRQSTIGWSITNILLDITGGILSIFQSLLVAYKNHDWMSLIVGNFTKSSLGLLSIGFDILFIIQHYCLYTEREETIQNLSTSSAVLCPPEDARIENEPEIDSSPNSDKTSPKNQITV